MSPRGKPKNQVGDTRTEQEKIADMKRRAVEYYQNVPIKKYAAASVGRDLDTIMRWEKDDAVFAAQLEEAKAIFVSKNVKKSSPQFILERLVRKEFGANLDVTSGGDKLETSSMTNDQLIGILERFRAAGDPGGQGAGAPVLPE